MDTVLVQESIAEDSGSEELSDGEDLSDGEEPDTSSVAQPGTSSGGDGAALNDAHLVMPPAHLAFQAGQTYPERPYH